ncbi:MAG: nucleoside recognition protein [Lachnospiraceae bacterium]|nr:nucleoside recognition protein [Lachnospiraceae bacterium]
MMSYLWGGMILIGIIYGAFTGNLQAVTDAALQSAQDAVTLCITMMGVMSMWVGLMEIAKESGVVERLTRIIGPALHFLFPKVPRGSRAEEYISLNVIANVLGLGWAATPAGLNAMKELENLRKQQGQAEGVATNEMCNFLIINISSLQLIPVNLIAYRSSYGSQNPTSIIAPAILATAFSTFVAIVFIVVINRIGKKHGRAKQ